MNKSFKSVKGFSSYARILFVTKFVNGEVLLDIQGICALCVKQEHITILLHQHIQLKDVYNVFM